MINKRVISLEIQRNINHILHNEGHIPKEMYECVNESLLKKIKEEKLLGLSS